MFYRNPSELFHREIPDDCKVVKRNSLRRSFQSAALNLGESEEVESLVLMTPVHNVVLLNRFTSPNSIALPELSRFWASYANWVTSTVLYEKDSETRMLNLWYAAVKASSIDALEMSHFSSVISMGVPNRIRQLEMPIESKLIILLVLCDAIERYSDEELVQLASIPKIFIERLVGFPSVCMPDDAWIIVD